MSADKKCSKCGALNPGEAQWCNQCFEAFEYQGGQVSWTCSQCGTTNPVTADLCTVCGLAFGMAIKQARTAPGSLIGELAAHPVRGLWGRAVRGFRLIGVSWQALKMDPELLVFPLVAGILSLGATFFWMRVFGISFEAVADEIDAVAKWQLWFFYASWYVVGVMCQASVVAAAMQRFKGGDPTLRSGFAAATKKSAQLITWALIAASAALVLRWLEESAGRRAGGAGRIAVRLVDIAWEVATYFAVPVILFEDVSPFGAVKRSGKIFRQNWTETLAGTLGMNVAISFVMLGVIFVGVFLIVYAGVAGVILTIGAIVLVSCIGATLAGIFNAALYYYATHGEPPIPFSLPDVYGRKILGNAV